MSKCLAKIGNAEVWDNGEYVKIIGIPALGVTRVFKKDFFLLEKLFTKVVRGFLKGD